MLHVDFGTFVLGIVDGATLALFTLLAIAWWRGVKDRKKLRSELNDLREWDTKCHVCGASESADGVRLHHPFGISVCTNCWCDDEEVEKCRKGEQDKLIKALELYLNTHNKNDALQVVFAYTLDRLKDGSVMGEYTLSPKE